MKEVDGTDLNTQIKVRNSNITKKTQITTSRRIHQGGEEGILSRLPSY